MKLLYINGNPQEENASYGQRAGRYMLDNYKGEVDIVNVYTDDIPLIDKDVLDGWNDLRKGVSFNDLKTETQSKIARMNNILEQFLAADHYVFVTPLWNLSITPMLKAYIDNITIAGKTFKYTENGPIGLLSDKEATIIQASGGIYSTEQGKKYDFGLNYLNQALGFIGIEKINKVYVEGTSMTSDGGVELLNKAYKSIDSIL